MEYEKLAPPEEEEEGFLEIISVNGLQLLPQGGLVEIDLSFKNTGTVADDFMWEARDQYGNLLGSDSGGLLNGLPVGYSIYGSFSFTMPNYKVDITITTYHKYGYTWLEDDIEYFTIMLLIDVSEGEYSGINWNTNISLGGITTDGTYLWITNYWNAKVYKYNMNGTYTGSYWSTNANPTGITTDGTYLWIADWYENKVYKFNMNGNYTGAYWSTNAYPTGITTNGEYFWITYELTDEVYKYDMNGNYTGEKWSTYAGGVFCNYPLGITTDGTYLWIASDWYKKVYKFTLDGTYVSSWPTNALNANPYGITTDGNYFWITDGDDKKVYKYGGPLTVTEGFLDITGVTAPSEASEGDAVQIIIHTKNTGVSDNFKVELSGDLTASQEVSLRVGSKKDFLFPFTMPNHDATITAKTFHLE